MIILEKNENYLESYDSVSEEVKYLSNSIIRLILDLYGAEEARKFFDNIQKLSNKYLEYRGFTSSFNDITYTPELEAKEQELIKTCIGKINVEKSKR